jgi:hypothetical protein
MLHRLFVDEVGNADLRSSIDPNHRYLSLTGVIVDMETYAHSMDARFNTIKQEHFETTGVVFHRRAILNRHGPFKKLQDDGARASFDEDLLLAISDLQYTVITVAIDKLEHSSRYGRWQYHPYHYCPTCMLERYVKWLRDAGSRGDVLAESRNGPEDEKLKAAFRRFFQRGSRFVMERSLLDRLTSGELKLQKKTANINGLQMADLLASPSFRRMLCEKEKQEMNAAFGRKVAEILLSKYHTSGGTHGINGYGCKWLP